MLTLLALFSLLNPAYASANGPCENLAKFEALRAYKADMGIAEDSDSLQTETVLTGIRGEYSSYRISFSDSTEESAASKIIYIVVVRKTNICTLISVKNSTL